MVNFASGSRRFVILTQKRAYKFPIFWDWCAFIAGVRENMEERYWWCSDSGVAPDNEWTHQDLARMFWGSRFGLCNVMERCDTRLHSDEHTEYETHKALEELKRSLGTRRFAADLGIENVGWTDEGKLVAIDYGFFNGMGDYHLARPNGFSVMGTLSTWLYRLKSKIEEWRAPLPEDVIVDRRVAMTYRLRESRKKPRYVETYVPPINRFDTSCDPSEYVLTNILSPFTAVGSLNDECPDYYYRVLRVRADEPWDVALNIVRRPTVECGMSPWRSRPDGIGTYAFYYVVERQRKTKNAIWARFEHCGTYYHRSLPENDQ